MHDMRRRVRRRGTVDIDAVGIAAAIEGVRQMQQLRFDVGLAALAGFEILGGRAHEECPAPQRAQIEIELAVVVDEQRAAAFALQYVFRGFGGETEIAVLPVEIALVSLRAPVGPAAQAAQGQLR